MSDLVSLWTRQDEKVLAELHKKGICQVKKAYIEQKYADAGWSFQIAYAFFTRHMAQILPPPVGCESPYWLHGSPEGTGVFSEAPLLHFDIPRESCVFFDSRDWNCVLNLSYLGTAAEVQSFQRELDRLGLSHGSEVFRQPYYPLQKRAIMESWQRLFRDQSLLDARFLQAALWELKTSWLCE